MIRLFCALPERGRKQYTPYPQIKPIAAEWKISREEGRESRGFFCDGAARSPARHLTLGGCQPAVCKNIMEYLFYFRALR
jgi:hypothetical protein